MTTQRMSNNRCNSRLSIKLIPLLGAIFTNRLLVQMNVSAFHPSSLNQSHRLHVAYSSSSRGTMLDKMREKNNDVSLFSHYLPSHSSPEQSSSHPEMPMDQEGGDGSGASASNTPTSNKSSTEMITLTSSLSSVTTPTRRVIHKNRKKKMRTRKNKNTAAIKHGPLNDKEELAMHVSSQYVAGPGGLFKQVDARRKRQEKASIFRNEDHCNLEQVEYLRKLDGHPALVLNADYQPLSLLPLSLWSWQDTVKALFSGKVRVVETYKDINIRAVNMDVPLPSVIALTEYVSQPNQKPAFTRRNVFLRDGYRCQYCGKTFKTCDLSLDHVVPRCAGGKLEWENAVTCCKKCNSKKGSTMPNQLRSIGMELIRKPLCPSKYDLAAEAGKMVPRRVHPTWRPFLGMDEEDEEDKSLLEKESRNYFDLL